MPAEGVAPLPQPADPAGPGADRRPIGRRSDPDPTGPRVGGRPGPGPIPPDR